MWNIDLDLNEMSIPSSPVDIIEKQCDYLREHTDGKIIAKTANREADGNARLLVQRATSNLKSDRKGIQRELGEVEKSDFAFEFFITSTGTPNYKFRVMFLLYGIELYPLLLVVDEDIAFEIGAEQIIIIENEEYFIMELEKILASPKVSKIINSLYAETLRVEKRYIPY